MTRRGKRKKTPLTGNGGHQWGLGTAENNGVKDRHLGVACYGWLLTSRAPCSKTHGPGPRLR